MAKERIFDLAVAGELNLDVILYGLPLELVPERDLLASSFVSTLGSSSAIVAHNASAINLRVMFQSIVGDDDFGRIALDRLRQMHVDVSRVIIDSRVTTGVTVLLPHEHVRHSFTYPGSIALLSVQQLDIEALKQARHFHLCSLFLQRNLHEGLGDLLQELKSAGLTISLDTNDDPTNLWGSPLAEILPYVDVFMPNEDELCRMAGGVSLKEAMASFAREVPTMVVKRGREGCRIREQGKEIDVPGFSVAVTDTIGAGDSFDAGFLAAYLQGFDTKKCGMSGNITGALSTQGSGGTEAFCDDKKRETFLREHDFLRV